MCKFSSDTMLTEEKKVEIQAAYAILRSYSKVAAHCHVGRSTVWRVIKNVSRSKGKRRGQPKKISKRTLRLIVRYIQTEIRAGHRVTSRSIKDGLNLGSVSRSTIRRTVRTVGILYKIAKKKLPITAKQRLNRINFARRHLLSGTDFSRWIFSDEKRFSMDGPDNLGSYCTGNAELNRIKRQMCGGGVMILGAISSKGHLLIKVALQCCLKRM